MATPATAPAASVIDALGADYTLRDPATVIDFLTAHPYLVPLLREASKQIERHFGSEPSVALEVVVDREDEGQRELFALIATDLPMPEARRRLDNLDAAWWLAALNRARCNLTIDIEPRPTTGGV